MSRASAGLKYLAECLLVRTGAPLLMRGLGRSRGIILAYHNIVSDDAPTAGDRSLHLPRRMFAAQLDWLARTHEVVPLERLSSGKSPDAGRPQAAITFDDAYYGAVRNGVAELVARKLPATFFIAPGRLGRCTFWWDALPLSSGFRTEALDELRGDEDLVRRQAAARALLEHALPEEYRTATSEEVVLATRSGEITLASHGWTHRSLVALPSSDLEDELAAPLAWLRARFPKVLPWIAYPYGSVDRRVLDAARAAGYVGGVRVGGARLRGVAPDPLALPRLNVPVGLSLRGFELAVSGLGWRP